MRIGRLGASSRDALEGVDFDVHATGEMGEGFGVRAADAGGV
jgi:hypothetical protein